jgi:hypothetical protein
MGNKFFSLPNVYFKNANLTLWQKSPEMGCSYVFNIFCDGVTIITPILQQHPELNRSKMCEGGETEYFLCGKPQSWPIPALLVRATSYQ